MEMDFVVELKVLGRSEVSACGRDSAPQPVKLQPKRFALFTYLAVARPKGFHRRDSLLVLFWPESAGRQARNALNQSVHSLRSALGDEVLVSRGYDEVGVAQGRVRCDAVAFDAAFEAGRYAEAFDQYHGALLKGLHVAGAPGFERWLDAERARLRRKAQVAASGLADLREREGNPVGAIRVLERAIELTPTDETLLRRLVALLDRSGDRAGALRAYDRFAEDLRTRYGIDPSPETRRMVSDVRKRTKSHTAVETVVREWAGSDDAKPRSLAVLPLVSLREEPEQKVFAEGLTEVLIGELAGIEPLRVISRQSVRRFGDSDRPLSEIGDVLGVDALIEGSLLRVGDRVRLSLQLVRIQPEEHLWAEAFERDLKDVLALQRDIARAVAEKVRGTLVGGHSAKGGAPVRKIEPAAFDAYLLGTVPVIDGRVDEYPSAIKDLERAVQLDPDFGEPLAQIAVAYANMTCGGMLSPEEARGPMRELALRALEVDAELGAALLAHALTLQLFDRDWEATREAYRKTEVASAATVFEPWTGWRTMFLACQGDFEEAVSMAREAYRKDPLGPASWLLGYTLHKARRFEESTHQLELTLSVWPDFPFTLPFLSASLLFAGRREEAARTARSAMETAPVNQLLLGYCSATLARSEEIEEARVGTKRLEEMRRESYVDPFNLAVTYAGLGEHPRALDELERLVEEGSPQSWAVPAEPFFDPLRDDPRFDSVLDRLDLPRLQF